MLKETYMQKRLMVRKRLKYPLFYYYGNVTENSLYTLSKHFDETPESLDTAKQLRLAQLDTEFNDIDRRHTVNYAQHDIQTLQPGTEFIEDNFTVLREEFETVHAEIAYLLQSPVCRMRYATIEENDDLTYHIDQPGKDRFVMVIEGAHVVHIKTKDETFKQMMLPGEVWYLNSNWEHKVENIGPNKRLALLGCFEYNEK